MKIKNIFLISALLVLFTTSCTKEDPVNPTPASVTSQLKGHEFTVYRVIDYVNNKTTQIYGDERFKHSYITMNTDPAYNCVKFYPDADTTLRMSYNFGITSHKLGLPQAIAVSFGYGNQLKINVPPGTPDLQITQGAEALNIESLQGYYNVFRSPGTDGVATYVLQKINSFNQLVMVIELI